MVLMVKKVGWEMTKISAIGKNNYGFTLIELAMVISLLLLITAAITPSLKRYKISYELKSTARELISIINYTHICAVTHRKKYRINFQLDKNQYWISKEDNNIYYPLGTEYGKPKELPEGVIIERINMPEENKTTGLAHLLFMPNGISQNVTIYLKNSLGEFYTITIDGFTSCVIGHEGKR